MNFKMIQHWPRLLTALAFPALISRLMANVAFIGTGIMGLPMAGHLLAAGHGMRVHTRTRGKASALLSRGAKWCDSPAQAASDAEFVFICVPDTPDVRAVISGEDGVLRSSRQGVEGKAPARTASERT